MEEQVATVRRFNRFYTRQIGVLEEGLLRSPFSLTEARVLYELAQRSSVTATELGETLALDAGYLSRIVRAFSDRGLVQKTPSPTDGRRSHLSLTAVGRKAFKKLDGESRREVRAMLDPLPGEERDRLVRAMEIIETTLGGPSEERVPYILRPHQPGDMGYVIHRHGVLYAEEYGFDETFEALVAEVVARFVQSYDPKRERCWIAEKDGEFAGSVFLVRKSDSVSQLRLLIVEPKARGLGIGKRLVQECVRFARQAGYETLTLWTQSNLDAARGIYRAEGFRLVDEKPHRSFGAELVGETWEKTL